MTIRPAGPTDAPLILELIREHADMYGQLLQVATTVEDVERFVVGPDAVARDLIIEVAGDDGEPVVAGHAVWAPSFSTWAGRPGIWLEDLYLRPAFRGLGLGSELLRHLRSMTDGRVEWEVRVGNDKAKAVYERVGAKELEGWTRMRWVAERTAAVNEEST